ncbi:MAG: glycosyltransferase family 25 protein [Candidatus Nomurabacteria bacterium]|nr:glycosyltransferase family 25 protein [Candidatus Nomurabacteria bacterium]USN88125.1 MAG: glycosyltransferase family 25 protein [Candidatus Nomurabacteria bacterium]
MKAFIINLAKDKERRQFMEEQMRKLNIPYEIITGTVGAGLSIKDRNTLYSPDLAMKENGHELSNSQIGIADSHRKAYERILQEKLPWALILEDDVLLDQRIISVLDDKFVTESGADWIQIDYVPMNNTFITNWIKATIKRTNKSHRFIFYALVKIPWLILWGMYEYTRELLARKGRPRAVNFLRPLYLASAYIVTDKGIKKMQPLYSPLRFAADRLQNQARIKNNLHLKAVVPLLAKQERERFASNQIYDNE